MMTVSKSPEMVIPETILGYPICTLNLAPGQMLPSFDKDKLTRIIRGFLKEVVIPMDKRVAEETGKSYSFRPFFALMVMNPENTIRTSQLLAEKLGIKMVWNLEPSQSIIDKPAKPTVILVMDTWYNVNDLAQSKILSSMISFSAIDKPIRFEASREEAPKQRSNNTKKILEANQEEAPKQKSNNTKKTLEAVMSATKGNENYSLPQLQQLLAFCACAKETHNYCPLERHFEECFWKKDRYELKSGTYSYKVIDLGDGEYSAPDEQLSNDLFFRVTSNYISVESKEINTRRSSLHIPNALCPEADPMQQFNTRRSSLHIPNVLCPEADPIQQFVITVSQKSGFDNQATGS